MSARLEHDVESPEHNKHGKQDDHEQQAEFINDDHQELEHELQVDEHEHELQAQHDEVEQQAEDPGEVFLMVEHEEHEEHGREFHKESEMIVTDEAMETMMERQTQAFT